MSRGRREKEVAECHNKGCRDDDVRKRKEITRCQTFAE